MLLSANSGMHGSREGMPRYDMVYEAVDFLADAGYDAIDISFCPVIYDGNNHEPILDGDGWMKNLDRLIDKCKQRSLQINTTHLPYAYDYGNQDIPEYQKFYDMTCRALVASEYIGAKWAVMHVTTVESTIAYVKRLFADTGIKNTGIAIENSPEISLEVLTEVHDTLKKEGYRVGICLDLGHCHVHTNYKYNVVEEIRRLGSRIQILHVHDNSKERDEHKEPYGGSIPWTDVMCALKEIGYTGDFNYEIITHRIPESARKAYEDYCVLLGRHLISIYDAYNI